MAGERAVHEAALAALVENAKSGACLGCGRADLPARAMHLVHRLGTVRRFSIADFRTLLPSVQVLLEEISRCDLLCATCAALRRAA